MNNYSIPKSSRIDKLINALFEKMPEIEADRGILITESYMKTKDKKDWQIHFIFQKKLRSY